MAQMLQINTTLESLDVGDTDLVSIIVVNIIIIIIAVNMMTTIIIIVITVVIEHAQGPKTPRPIRDQDYHHVIG